MGCHWDCEWNPLSYLCPFLLPFLCLPVHGRPFSNHISLHSTLQLREDVPEEKQKKEKGLQSWGRNRTKEIDCLNYGSHGSPDIAPPVTRGSVARSLQRPPRRAAPTPLRGPAGFLARLLPAGFSVARSSQPRCLHTKTCYLRSPHNTDPAFDTPARQWHRSLVETAH